MADRSTVDTEAMKSLADLLRRAPRVVKLARSTDPGSAEDVATEAAAGLMDIQRSSDVLFKELLPKLRSLSPEGRAFEDVLDDIAEEYRHINYHIANTRLFSYVVPKQ
jgi:hypothetical protein